MPAQRSRATDAGAVGASARSRYRAGTVAESRGTTPHVRSTAALLALGLLATGCSPRLPTAAPNEPAARPRPTADPNALVWGLSAAVSTLDAARLAADPSGIQVSAQIYDRLMAFRPGTAELAPGLAEDWDVDVTGRYYSFTLRRGLTFHDGTALDAPAVAWNFERWMDPEHPQHRDDFRTWLALFGGFRGSVDGTGRPMDLVEKVEVLDAVTIRISLREPFAPFPVHLAMVPFGIASPAAVRNQGESYGLDSMHLPVGSGPYRAESWSTDGTIRLVPFAQYRSVRAGAHPLQFVVVPDPDRRASLVASGSLHGTELPATTTITGTLAGPDVVITARPPRCNSWLVVNHSKAPLDDVRVRRAISLAIDRARLIRENFGSLALPANQLLPSGFIGYHDALPPPVYDPNASRELLAEAGMQDGFRLIVWAPSSPRAYLPDPAGVAESIASMLRDVGIDASVRTKSLRQFLADRDNGRYNAWIIGWEAQSADPDNFWFWHFGAGRAASEGQYYNDALAAQLLQAQRAVGGAARAELYRSAAESVMTDAARAFLVHSREIIALSPRVRGYEADTMGFDNLSAVRLAPAPSGATSAPVPTSAPGTPTVVPAEGGETPVSTTPEASTASPESPPSTAGPSGG